MGWWVVVELKAVVSPIIWYNPKVIVLFIIT